MVGISRDRLPAQQRFTRKSELPYPLLADPRSEAIRAYGVAGMLGFAKRVTFLIDAGGRISKVYDRVSVRSHAEDVLNDLREGG